MAWVLRYSNYGKAQDLARITTRARKMADGSYAEELVPVDQVRWAQGVIAQTDFIFDTATPEYFRRMKSEYLQTLEERASVDSESETEND